MDEGSDGESNDPGHISRGSLKGTFETAFDRIKTITTIKRPNSNKESDDEEELTDKELEKLAMSSRGSEYIILENVPILKEVFESELGRKILTDSDKMTIHDSDVNLNVFYRFAHFVQKYRVNRGFDHITFIPFRMLSVLLSRNQYLKYKRRLSKIWSILFPENVVSKNNHKRISHRLMSYIVELFWEIVFYVSNHRVYNYQKFIKVKNLDYVFNALKKGRGVLAPILHLWEMFHPLSALVRHAYVDDKGKRHQVKIAIIASAENEYLFRELLGNYRSVKAIVTGKFTQVKPEVEQCLRENRVVFLMQDYTNKNQLRVPFIYGVNRYEFLIPTPQLMAHFHLNPHYHSPIVPMLAIPDGDNDIRFSKVIIFKEIDFFTMDPAEEEDPVVRAEIERFQKGELSQKQQRGIIQLYINRMLYPFILKYPYAWEEAIPFLNRTDFKIDCSSVKDYPAFFRKLVVGLKELIENSYEPGRDDESILKQIEISLSESNTIDIKYKNGNFSEFTPKDAPKKEFPSEVNLGRLRGKDALKRVVALLHEYLPHELEAEYIPYIHILEKLKQYWPIRAYIPTYRLDKWVVGHEF